MNEQQNNYVPSIAYLQSRDVLFGETSVGIANEVLGPPVSILPHKLDLVQQNLHEYVRVHAHTLFSCNPPSPQFWWWWWWWWGITYAQ